MRILVIDAQGGGIGKQLIAAIKQELPEAKITAVGTNSNATAVMLKSGADEAATGENSVVVCAKNADVIVGPIGIVIADALLGEITPKMALAVAQSNAARVLIPFNHCDNYIAGVSDLNTKTLINDAVRKIKALEAEY
ncbi:MAG: DUF3842 family protein [Clostridia bacterium]|jgi:hypothetical protein|nr:DUF3842 family protein [Clostridia bacterium]MBR4657979.1 DUF3842 family protein [Clostridia bacterium]